jgi:hypothetical protein
MVSRMMHVVKPVVCECFAEGLINMIFYASETNQRPAIFHDKTRVISLANYREFSSGTK